MANRISEIETKQQTKDRQRFMFYLAYLNVQNLQCNESPKGRTEKQLHLINHTEPLCCKFTSALKNSTGFIPALFFLISGKPRQRSGNGRLLDCLVVEAEIPQHFNLRVEYIRPTALTRFTCCHLPPVGGEIWGSEADRGKAHIRWVHTRDRYDKILLRHPKQSSTLSSISAKLFTSLWLLVHQMTASKQWHS